MPLPVNARGPLSGVRLAHKGRGVEQGCRALESPNLKELGGLYFGLERPSIE
jgi:hypothetical protein